MDSITSMFDEILAPISGKASPADMSTEYMSELYAVGIEGLSDWLLSPLGSGIVQTVTGIALGAVGTTMDIPDRLRAEILEMSSHELFRLVDILPKKSAQVSDNVNALVEGIKSGDLEKVKDSLLKDFETLKSEMGLKNTTSSNVSEDVADQYQYEEIPITAGTEPETEESDMEEPDILAA